MDRDIFMSYAAKAASQFEEDVQRGAVARYWRHWHAGYNIPGGGRIYFEVRRDDNGNS